jgi:uncharacterized iron-regulated protein
MRRSDAQRPWRGSADAKPSMRPVQPTRHSRPRSKRSTRGFRQALCGLLSCAAISGCSAQRLLPSAGFTQVLGRQHPLAGQVWNVARAAPSNPEELHNALENAAFVVLGETHDNRDHHLLQAQLVERFTTTHRHAHIAFEMLDEDQAAALSGRAPVTADELARRVHWDSSGWPAFELYRPVFTQALANGARIVAAHPNAKHVRESMAGVTESEAQSLRLNTPLDAQQQAAQREEIRASHCGQAPDAMVSAMQLAQSYKDAFMARALIRTGAPSLLLAGRGHARNDRAVPLFLRRQGAASVLSVAFVDVENDRTQVSDYDVGAFDFVVFTPRVTDEDACERFKAQLDAMRKQHAAPGAPIGGSTGP